MNKFVLCALGLTVSGLLCQSGKASAQVQVLGQAQGSAATAKYEPKGNAVYHGAGLPDYWSEAGLRTQIDTYTRAAGKKTSVITWFASAYENGIMTNWRQNYAHNLTRVKRMGSASLIKFSTQDSSFPGKRNQANLKEIAAGKWDPYFNEMAAVIRDFKSPVFVSIDHEMNGNWYPYSQDYPGSGYTTQDFIGAWQRIVNLFRAAGASNVAWVWSPNVPDVGKASFSQYYPGDGYVDWIGVSFYSGNDAFAMDTIYKAYAAKKPFFITEWATAPEQSRHNVRFPGEVEWVRQFFAALETRYPRVKAISWFNYDKEDGDYRLQRVPQQASMYASDVANQRYVAQDKGLVGTNWNVETATLDMPGQEIVLREKPRVEPQRVVQPRVVSAPVMVAPIVTPPVAGAPVRRSLRDLVKIEVVKSESVR